MRSRARLFYNNDHRWRSIKTGFGFCNICHDSLSCFVSCCWQFEKLRSRLVKTHVLNANPRTIAFFTYYKLSKCFHAYTYYLVIYSIPRFVGKINLHLFCGNRIKIWLIFKRHPGYIPGWQTSKIQPKGVAMSPNKWTPSAFPLASESVWSNPKHPFWADFHHLLHLSETAETAILACSSRLLRWYLWS